MSTCFQKLRATTPVLVVAIALMFTLCASMPAPDKENFSSRLQEHQSCNVMIPKFITQVMSNDANACEELGAFPKPGNCSVFFKCVQSSTKIQPYLEYCSVGYNFINGACHWSNGNVSDCPQFTCRIPDSAHDNGNELEPNELIDKKDPIPNRELILPAVPFISTTPATTHVDAEPPTQPPKGIQSQNELTETVHSEQFMQMTHQKENSGSCMLQYEYVFVYFATYFVSICWQMQI